VTQAGQQHQKSGGARRVGPLAMRRSDDAQRLANPANPAAICSTDAECHQAGAPESPVN